ncbi:MAG: response regulator [Acidobacteriota bacterium]
MLDAPDDFDAERSAPDAARILLIDDDRTFLRSLAGLVGTLGWPAIEAEDGLTGLALYRRYRPALVLVDVLMPGLDGIETVVQLRHVSRGVKIVAMSGGGEIGKTECLAAAIRFGADLGLQKPFDGATLAGILETLLHRRRRPAPLAEVAGAVARLPLLTAAELAR